MQATIAPASECEDAIGICICHIGTAPLDRLLHRELGQHELITASRAGTQTIQLDQARREFAVKGLWRTSAYGGSGSWTGMVTDR